MSLGPRPRTERGPFFQLGPVGPCTRMLVTISGPTSARNRARIRGASSRSWVAHAVDSAATTKSPSRSETGWQCPAIPSPTR